MTMRSWLEGVGRTYISILFLFLSFGANAQLWVEDFAAEANGAQAGTAGGTLGGTWSTSHSGTGTFAKANLPIVGEGFHASGTTSEAVWSTNIVDITSVGYAIINVDVFSAFVDDNDYLRIAYVLDGVEVMFYELIGGNGFVDFAPATPASAIVAGNSLQLKIYSRNDPGFIPFFNDQYAFDNVTITAAPIIYSRTSGSWTNAVAGTGTWSLTGHAGASCACYPLNTQVAIIGAGHTVTLQSSQTATGTPPTTNLAPGAVDIYGTLQYSTNNNVTLGIQQGLFRVRSGGVVNSNPGTLTGETISFQADVGGATFQVDAGGSATIEDLALATAAANLHYLTGGGTFSITDDILIEASGATLTNNRSAFVTISGDVDFNGAGSAFVNNAAMTITGDILMDGSNSSFTNNASTLSVGDDVDFSGANSTFVNNATMTLGDDILMDAGNSLFSNNASLTITDDLNFNSTNSAFSNNATASIADIVSTDNADDDNVVTNSSGATLGLGGVNANDADLDILNSGTINQSGNFSNISATDTNLDNLATGVWVWTLTPNTTYDTDVATVLNLTAIGNTFNYNGAGTQRIIPTTYHHITLSNAGAKDANNASFAVQGNWTASGSATFTEGTGTITLNGSVSQSITNPSGETFYNLTTNNSFGTSPQITLGNAVTVTGTLTMSDGNVDLNGNTFTIGTSAASTGTLSHAGASTNGWMYEGSLIRYMATAATTIGTADQNEGFFPLGSASDWRPFYIGKSNIASSGGRITVSHTNSTSTSTVAIVDTGPAATIRRRHNSFWTVATSGITAGTWALRAGGTNFGTIQEVADLRMCTSSGVVGTNSGGSGTTGDCRVNRTNLSVGQLANNFHVGSTDQANSPLPIELVSFSAQLKNDEIELRWSTASETNNDYFTIERAIDIEHFEQILFHDGQGTSKELNHYKVMDSSPLYGRSYYRLKQTDFDGKFTYSDVRIIDYEGPAFATLTAFPNPVNTATFTLKIEGLKEASDVPVQILNLQGQKVFETVVNVRTPGIITKEISRNAFPSPGLYIIKAGSTLYLTKKMVVE